MQGTHHLVATANRTSSVLGLEDTTRHFEVIREVYRLLAPYQVGGAALTPQTVISKGLTVDSLTIMDVIMELEDRFDVTIPMNVAADIVTIDQLADTVVALSTRR